MPASTCETRSRRRTLSSTSRATGSSYVVPTRRFDPKTGSQSVSLFPGSGVAADGVELRFFATLTPEPQSFKASVANHELMHTFGLPETRFSPEPAGSWDAMGA